MRILALAAILIIVSACEGPEGAVGPQGEQGVAGLEGPAGSANVQAVTFTLRSSQFIHRESTSTFSRATPEITRDVLQNGVVLAYTDLGTDKDGWWALPQVYPVSNITLVMNFAYVEEVFAIQITSNSTENFSSVFDGFTIKCVIIPTVAAKTRVDYSDYEAVARHYGL